MEHLQTATSFLCSVTRKRSVHRQVWIVVFPAVMHCSSEYYMKMNASYWWGHKTDIYMMALNHRLLCLSRRATLAVVVVTTKTLWIKHTKGNKSLVGLTIQAAKTLMTADLENTLVSRGKQRANYRLDCDFEVSNGGYLAGGGRSPESTITEIDRNRERAVRANNIVLA